MPLSQRKRTAVPTCASEDHEGTTDSALVCACMRACMHAYAIVPKHMHAHIWRLASRHPSRLGFRPPESVLGSVTLIPTLVYSRVLPYVSVSSVSSYDFTRHTWILRINVRLMNSRRDVTNMKRTHIRHNTWTRNTNMARARTGMQNVPTMQVYSTAVQ